MRKILLIGGTGLMGPHVVSSLQNAGDEVVCINRSGRHPAGGQAYKCDRQSLQGLKSIFAEHSDFALIDMIPYSASQAGTLIDALDGRQVPLTAVSSIDVYEAYNILHKKSAGPIQKTPLTETSNLRECISFQGASYDKLNSEKIYWSYFDSCSVVRLPAIYGLPDTSRVSYYSIPIYESGEVTINTEFSNWKFSRSSNVNCAHAIALCSTFLGREVFNVSEQYHYSELEWCKLIASVAGIDVSIHISDTAETTFDINSGQDWFVDSSKIRERLGYEELQTPEELILEVLTYLHPTASKADIKGV